MKLPLSLEDVYLSIVSRKTFASGEEDLMQINQEAQIISEFFSSVSQKSAHLKCPDFTPIRFRHLLHAYQGLRISHRRVRFVDYEAS